MKTSAKIASICFSLAFFVVVIHEIRAGFAYRSAQPSMDFLLEKSESLVYSVHYGFLNLGQVILEPVRDTVYLGEPAFYYKTIIRSNPSIPFVGRKERHYHSIFQYDDDIAWGLNFWTDNIDSDEYLDSRYVFDYDNHQVLVYEFEELVEILPLDQAADSGPVLYYITRLFAGTDQMVNYPIYISNEKGNVELNFTSRLERMNSPAFNNEPISVYYSSGDARLKGPFGFSGAFRAWHLNDETRLPIEAHVRVWVGNVKVRLQNYERR